MVEWKGRMKVERKGKGRHCMVGEDNSKGKKGAWNGEQLNMQRHTHLAVSALCLWNSNVYR